MESSISILCDSCGSRIPIADRETVTCQYCQNIQKVPEEMRQNMAHASQQHSRTSAFQNQSSELRKLGSFAFGYEGKKKVVFGVLGGLWLMVSGLGYMASADGAVHPAMFILPAAVVFFMPAFIYSKVSASKYRSALAALPVAHDSGKAGHSAQCPNCGSPVNFYSKMTTECKACGCYSAAPDRLANTMLRGLRKETSVAARQVDLEASTIASTGQAVNKKMMLILMGVGILLVLVMSFAGIMLYS